MKKWTTLMLARAGLFAALYVALTFACFPVASGLIQFRVSEMLTLLPLFYIEAIPALFIGCIISNLISGCVLWDILLGSIITLIAAIATYFIGKAFKNPAWRILLGGAFPVMLNALFLPLIWWLAYGELSLGYWLNVGFLTLSQGVIIWGMGTALYFALQKLTKLHADVFSPTNNQE